MRHSKARITRALSRNYSIQGVQVRKAKFVADEQFFCPLRRLHEMSQVSLTGNVMARYRNKITPLKYY